MHTQMYGDSHRGMRELVKDLIIAGHLSQGNGRHNKPVGSPGYGVSGHAEAAVHAAARLYFGQLQDDHALVKLDFRNAFNSVPRCWKLWFLVIYIPLSILCTPHLGAWLWLYALPISRLGLRMDDNTVGIAMGLHLGSTLCRPHDCQHCGAEVDHLATHGLSCKNSEGCHYRHGAIT